MVPSLHLGMTNQACHCHCPHLVVSGVVVLGIRVREAHSWRRLEIQKVCNLVPAELVLIKCFPIVLYLRNKTFVEVVSF